MKTIVPKPTEIEISHLLVDVPVNYDEEDIPYDFPHRKEDRWRIKVNIDTGEIEGWPQGRAAKMDMKVTDGGTYTLLAPDGSVVAKIEEDYVPGSIGIGGSDYIELEITEQGFIKDWPRKPDVRRFFGIETD